MTSSTASLDANTSLAKINPQQLITTALEHGADVAVLERLWTLAERVREVGAREQWYAAMAGFQAECPVVFKNRQASIPTRGGGSFSYSFADLAEILETVQPTLGKFGLSLSWKTAKIEAARVVVECIVAHRAGHSESSGPVEMPVTQRGADEQGGATPAQRVGIALSYARRYAATGILGIAPRDGSDRDGGAGEDTTERAPVAAETTTALITEPQLRRFSAIATGARWSDEDVQALIRPYASRKDIRQGDYERIVDWLKAGPEAWRRHEQQQAATRSGGVRSLSVRGCWVGSA